MSLNISQKVATGTLAGTVAIVSGSSAGIGAAIARELSARGAQVVVNYPFVSLKAEAEDVCSSLSTPGIAVEADMSTTDGPEKLVKETVKHFGRLDILVNNAAIIANAPLEEITLDSWNTLVNTNGRGVLLLTKAAVSSLTPGRGRIVNIVSTGSRYPPALSTVYAGTKGMVESFTRCWAKELPPKFGCTVNSISPGPTLTQGLKEAKAKLPNLSTYLDAEFAQTPVAKRGADPSEIAYAVAMLCEEPARWINGTHVSVTGGLSVD